MVREQKVVVMGLGYVGLPVAVCAADAGYAVAGYDVDKTRIADLQRGTSYVEDVPGERLRAALGNGRLRVSSSADICTGFDVAVITVPTPLHEGVPDLSYVKDAARTLAEHLRPGALVVLESTSYPGTTEELVGPMLHAATGLRPGTAFGLGYSPERIDPGNRQWTFTNTPKVVSGVDDASLRRVRDFYSTLVERTVDVPSPKEAELAKLLENTFRHVNIALVNELAVFAADLGIDIWAAIEAASTKPFGYMPFTPGPGVGGHCLPIDPSYLSWRVRRSLGTNFRFVELANDVNEHMPDYVVRRVTLALNRRRQSVNGSRVLLLGLSYKRNTGDAREAPAAGIGSRLLALGAEVRACDPYVVESHVSPEIVRVDLTPAEVRSADAVVLVTDHDDFDYDLVARHARYVFDTRHRIEGDNVETL
jgi:UDP-N-acetyl-D-glucosamine dehydrogenase